MAEDRGLLSGVKRALVLSPHTDDGEFGCGGTIARLIEEGASVWYAAFSACEESVPSHLPKDILVREVHLALDALAVPPEQRSLFRYPVRHFDAHRQEILEQIWQLRRDVEPDLVLLPSQDDLHQDHQVIAREGLRVFKARCVLGYEQPWNNIRFESRAFVRLDDAHVTKKIKAVLCYESQAHRPYAREEFIRSLATTRGVQIAVPYAEAFDVGRWIV